MTPLKIALIVLALPLLVPHTVVTAGAAVWLIRRALWGKEMKEQIKCASH